MVFVTLGNQNFQFLRLLQEVEKLKLEGTIATDVVVQTGHTAFRSAVLETKDFFTKQEFLQYVDQADYIITHAGTGSIISGLKKQKKVVAIARLAKFQEHIDDHQLEIMSVFRDKNLILSIGEDMADLKAVLQCLPTWEPSPFISNNQNFNKDLLQIVAGLLTK